MGVISRGTLGTRLDIKSMSGAVDRSILVLLLQHVSVAVGHIKLMLVSRATEDALDFLLEFLRGHLRMKESASSGEPKLNWESDALTKELEDAIFMCRGRTF